MRISYQTSKKKKKQKVHHTITQGTSQCHCNGSFISAVLAAGYFGPGGPSNGVNLSNKFYLKYARGRQVVQAKWRTQGTKTIFLKKGDIVIWAMGFGTSTTSNERSEKQMDNYHAFISSWSKCMYVLQFFHQEQKIRWWERKIPNNLKMKKHI